MDDELAQKKRAAKLREQLAALQRGEKPKPESLRDAVEEAAERARKEAEQSPDGGDDDKHR